MSSLDFGELLRAVLVTLVLLPMGSGHATAGGTRLVLHLQAPAAALSCPDCIGPAQRQAVARAGALLADPLADPVATLERFFSHGASLGGTGFGGLSVDLRRLDPGDGGSHHLAL